MALQSVLAYAAGKLSRAFPLQASAGVASAGSLVALNPSGVIDASMIGAIDAGAENAAPTNGSFGVGTDTAPAYDLGLLSDVRTNVSDLGLMSQTAGTPIDLGLLSA